MQSQVLEHSLIPTGKPVGSRAAILWHNKGTYMYVGAFCIAIKGGSYAYSYL